MSYSQFKSEINSFYLSILIEQIPKFGFMFQHLTSPLKLIQSLWKFRELGNKQKLYQNLGINCKRNNFIQTFDKPLLSFAFANQIFTKILQFRSTQNQNYSESCNNILNESMFVENSKNLGVLNSNLNLSCIDLEQSQRQEQNQILQQDNRFLCQFCSQENIVLVGLYNLYFLKGNTE
ncbi:hypothetical protein PPERSA_11842 [Pseudocohnilembus persalinus]|uniref:Uncharacterized protein n=1 Tax=Pseudocohnilembus persalinus TaxID=266149 RepID=A0A0V0QJX1_PSEPJ|nr:hypothetical protein PPERSA_11842 [Pseudocohnilembus persalinus]|eukprot:KRX02502.1 hypothetical protein PPERSA_11842 [Pseudocohnilembus persalinus]